MKRQKTWENREELNKKLIEVGERKKRDIEPAVRKGEKEMEQQKGFNFNFNPTGPSGTNIIIGSVAGAILLAAIVLGGTGWGFK